MITLETVQNAIGQQMPTIEYTFTQRDTVLYALGVGAPADWLDPHELKFVYELSADFCALPSMPVIYANAMIDHIVKGDIAGIPFNPMMLVHGEQALTIKAPLPVAGTIRCTPTISAIYDKGSGMLIVTDVACVDTANGSEIALLRSSMFIRGLGGFGGERGPGSDTNQPPDRAPDAVHEEATVTTQALLYRLSGDINPLHADPQMAALGQFDRPILHGLATFGFATRAILKHLAGNDPTRFTGIQARFSKHVFPGETLITEMWQVDGGVIFQTKVKERDSLALTHARVDLI